MEMLNNFSTLLAAGGLWGNLISFFADWLVKYGWAIIVFTICLKLVLSPLDILQRVSSSKQQKVMSAMQPEINALQQKYGNNKEKLNQETAKLYKKHNVGMGGMCLTMLITMVLTMVVFFTLYSGLREYGAEKLYQSYTDLRQTHIEAVEYANTNPNFTTNEEKESYIVSQIELKHEEQSKRNSWLWVKNVWKGDTKDDQFVDFEVYAEKYFADLDETALNDERTRYDYITNKINAVDPGQNGYYILIILAAVISFLTQFLSAKLLTPKGQKMNTMNKVMFAVIPVTMVIFASTSNVVFTLYVITNSLMAAIISTIMSIILKNKNKNQPEEIVLKKKNIEVVEYSRNYKK